MEGIVQGIVAACNGDLQEDDKNMVGRYLRNNGKMHASYHLEEAEMKKVAKALRSNNFGNIKLATLGEEADEDDDSADMCFSRFVVSGAFLVKCIAAITADMTADEKKAAWEAAVPDADAQVVTDIAFDVNECIKDFNKYASQTKVTFTEKEKMKLYAKVMKEGKRNEVAGGSTHAKFLTFVTTTMRTLFQQVTRDAVRDKAGEKLTKGSAEVDALVQAQVNQIMANIQPQVQPPPVYAPQFQGPGYGKGGPKGGPAAPYPSMYAQTKGAPAAGGFQLGGGKGSFWTGADVEKLNSFKDVDGFNHRFCRHHFTLHVNGQRPAAGQVCHVANCRNEHRLPPTKEWADAFVAVFKSDPKVGAVKVDELYEADGTLKK